MKAGRVALVAAATLAAAIAVAILNPGWSWAAGGPPGPEPGISLANGARDWWTCSHDGHANLTGGYDARNNGRDAMCIGNKGWNPGFQIRHSSVNHMWGNYPNVFKGCESEGQTMPDLCTHGWGLPKRVGGIRKDVSSVSYYYPQRGFAGNLAYDIWFNKEGTYPQGRADGAEVMVWLGSKNLGRPYGWKYVKVDGIEWAYDAWIAGPPGHHWNYIRYWRASGWTPGSRATLDLVGFFRDAEKEGLLSSKWFLTGTEIGSEVCWGGKGLAIKSFSAQV